MNATSATALQTNSVDDKKERDEIGNIQSEKSEGVATITLISRTDFYNSVVFLDSPRYIWICFQY